MGKRKRGSARALDGHEDAGSIDPKASKLKFNSYADLADSEDEFHINKDKILLNGNDRSKTAGYQLDDELQLSDEEVLAYSSDDSADKGEPDATSDDESQLSRDFEGEGQDEISGWGSSRADYYNADVIQTEQDALDEEAEARRIQQKRLKALNDADFGFDESEWLHSRRGGTVDEGSDDDENGGVITEVLPQLQITKDMGPVERLKLLKTRYPEFEPLAKEMMELQPLHTGMKAELERQPQNSDMKLKLNALSAYLGALAMYFAILTSPASTTEAESLPIAPSELREHEIMDTLVRSRDLWENVKDLQRPLTPQESIDDASDLSDSFETALENGQDSEDLFVDAQNQKRETEKTQQKADPAVAASLARRAARVARTEASLAALTSSINAQNNNARRSKNSMEVSQRNQTLHGNDSDADSDLGDEAEPELENRRKKSLKFYTSQIAQKSAKRQNAGRNVGGDEDVPHRERLRDRQERLNREAEKRGRNDSTELTNTANGEDENETNQQREARLRDSEEEGSMDGSDQKFLEQMLAKKENKRARRENNTGSQHQNGGRGGREAGNDANARAEGNGRREITYAISANKGLTPKRNKDAKNPRVKKRKRFEDKKKKLRSMKPTYKGGEGRGGYAGELTGIKKGLIRSVKL